MTGGRTPGTLGGMAGHGGDFFTWGRAVGRDEDAAAVMSAASFGAERWIFALDRAPEQIEQIARAAERVGGDAALRRVPRAKGVAPASVRQVRWSPLDRRLEIDLAAAKASAYATSKSSLGGRTLALDVPDKRAGAAMFEAAKKSLRARGFAESRATSGLWATAKGPLAAIAVSAVAGLVLLGLSQIDEEATRDDDVTRLRGRRGRNLLRTFASLARWMGPTLILAVFGGLGALAAAYLFFRLLNRPRVRVLAGGTR